MKGNLLVVDDEPLLIESLKYILRNTADKIFFAQNGLEALEIVSVETIHCILCDINMPVMNGVEFLKEIRSKENPVPFIFYTGHGNRDLMLTAIRYGALDFINKPHLVGLEKIVENGLKVGTNQVPDIVNEHMMSEYKKLFINTCKP